MKYSLDCTNGDPFYIIGYVANAMRECGMSNADIDAYSKKLHLVTMIVSYV